MAVNTRRRPTPDVEARRERVAQLLHQGFSYRYIAQAVGVRSHVTIANDVDALRVIWHEKAWRTYDAHVDEMLARIENVEAEAWAAFERSKGQRAMTATKLVRQGEGDNSTTRDEASDRRENRDGDPRWLMVVLKCQEQRAQILGVKEAGKVMPARLQPPAPTAEPDDHAVTEEPAPRPDPIVVFQMVIEAGGVDAWLALQQGEAEEDDEYIDAETAPPRAPDVVDE